MAKTIKFNLILDDCSVRNLDGVREHFSIEDILKYFQNGLLLRWLDVRGFKEEYEKVKKIGEKGKEEIISDLIRIFEIEIEEKQVKEEIAILSYLDKENEQNAIYKENHFEKTQVIKDYHSGYENLIAHMEENKEDLAVLKADSFELEREYLGLFKLDKYALYFRLYENAPKAIFAMLTKEKIRNLWMDESGNEQLLRHIKRNLLSSVNVKAILGDDLKIVKRDTQAMWDQIERPEVKVMVISIENGTFVKNAGEFAEKLGYEEANEKLLILNGLEYQCNNAAYELCYMEV